MPHFGRVLLPVMVGFGIGLLVDARTETTDQTSMYVLLGIAEAAAAPRHHVRRVSRRTARRTTRRTVYRHSVLPVGCPLVGAYYYCGGMYYQPVVESGATYYIIVTP